MCRFVSGFSFPFHWCMCLFLCQHHIVLIVRLWNIVLNQEAWYLQLRSSFSGLLWLFVVFRIIVLFLWKIPMCFCILPRSLCQKIRWCFFPSWCIYIFITIMCAVLCKVTSVMSDSVTPWTIAHQGPLSRGCSRQEYWNGLPCPPPRDLRYPGIKPASFISLALAGGFFTTRVTCEAQNNDNA